MIMSPGFYRNRLRLQSFEVDEDYRIDHPDDIPSPRTPSGKFNNLTYVT